MKLRRTCKEVTRLVLQGHDRPFTLAERVSLRLHWWACEGCTRFRRQSELMQQAAARWRAYRDEA